MTPPPQRPVTDALLTRLRSTGETVGDGEAPAAAGQWYATLLYLGGAPEGGLWPEHGAWMTYRLRCVGVDPSKAPGREGPRIDAEVLADALRPLLLDRSTKIEGPGWRITSRSWMPNGADRDGRTVNVTDDFRFLVVPR